MTPEEQSELTSLAQEANDRMVKAGADSAEQSFGLGCLLGAVPVVGVIVVLLLTGKVQLVLAFIILIMAALVVAGTAGLVASAARARSIGNTYQLKIRPEIESYLHKHNLDSVEFDAMIHDYLPGDAPLLAYRPVNTASGTENQE